MGGVRLSLTTFEGMKESFLRKEDDFGYSNSGVNSGSSGGSGFDADYIDQNGKEFQTAMAVFE